MYQFSKISYIYSLNCPITNEIKYIGKTIDPNVRLKSHLSEVKKKTRNKKNNWVISLTRKGLVPIMKIIEVIPFDQEDEREIFWIDYYRNLGFDLKNLTIGGSGRRSPENDITRPIIRSDGKIFKSLKETGIFYNCPYYIISNAIKYRSSRFGYRFGYLGEGILKPNYTTIKIYVSDGNIFHSRQEVIKFYNIEEKNFTRALNKGFFINGLQFSYDGKFKEFVHTNAKKVICHENKKIYPSCYHAAKDLNIGCGGISRCARKERKSYKGMTFSYLETD